MKLQAIRIGDLSIATLPNEVYAITGLKLRQMSPFGTHFNIELANGAEGYIPPTEQHTLGGYTTWPARTAGLEEFSEYQMVDRLAKMTREFASNAGEQRTQQVGVYPEQIWNSKPLAFFECNELKDDHQYPIDGRYVWLSEMGACARGLPGVGAGLGYCDESHLKLSSFSTQGQINRSIQTAGGWLQSNWTVLRLLPLPPHRSDPSSIAVQNHASIALWFWLGHESGASDRTGELINALGVNLKAHQFPDHTVQLELSSRDSKVVEGFSPSGAANTKSGQAAGKESDHGLKPMTTFADDWHFAVLIRDGENVRVHLDGGEKPVLTGEAGKAADEVIFGKGLEGRLDEITIWDRVVEPELIAKLWNISKVADDNARHAIARQEKSKRAQVQTSAALKAHENWSVSMRFRSTKANNASAVTAYLISRGPKGDSQAPGDHLGIGGTYKDSLPGRLFVFNGNAADQIVRGKTIIEPRTWNDVKLERIGSRVKVMLNGKVEIDADLPVTAPGAKELFFGRRCDDFAPLEGEFEKVEAAGLSATASWSAVASVSATPLSKAGSSSNAKGRSTAVSSMPGGPGISATALRDAGATKKVPTASQPLSPEESAKKWHVRDGYRIELVAAEPVVLDPVAFDWDEKGRLWVIEMADYPLGMDGNGKAGGRVVMLEDTDADGRYDKRTVIVSDLSYPTGILTWREGVIVTAAPDIFFISPDGTKKVLYTGFSTGNQQLRVNGLRWGMDGWVYCAAGAHHGGYNKGTQIECKLTGEKIDLGSRDFRFKPDTGEFDPQSGPSQFGRARDDWGHWFGVQNSFPLWHYVLQDHYLRRNPHVIPPDPIHQLFPRNPPVYPASSMEKRFHSFDQSGRFTSACGIEIYRDRVLFEDGKTHAFTCEPFHNVVQHNMLEDDGVTFKAVQDDTPLRLKAELRTDFLASEDRWCRPVMVRTGPDGALWVADMYRYMIEHPQWLPQNGKEELLPHYREGDDKGRIWRVVKSSHLAPQDEQSASDGEKLASKGRAQLISQERDGYLASPNGWLRDKAQMMALWAGVDQKALVELFSGIESKISQVRAQSAWTLHQAGKLSPETLKLLLLDDNEEVVIQALQIAETMPWESNEEALLLLLNGNRFSHPRVRMQLALSAGQWSGDWPADIVASILDEAEPGSALSGAAYSSCLPHLKRICSQFGKYESEPAHGIVGNLLRCAMAAKNEDAIAALLNGSTQKQKLIEVLTVLDEKNLSLSQFAKQVSSPEAQAGLKKMVEMLATAAAAVKSAKEAPPMAELALLASDREHREMVKEMLPELWAKTGSAEVLRLVGRLQPKAGEQFLLEGWEQRTPAVRGQIIETLLSNDAWTLALLNRPEAKACDAATRARLVKHPKKNIAKLAAKVFADSTSATRTAVVEKFKPALKLTGDAAKGKVVFSQVCISCHKLDGVGLELGPDLRSVREHDAEKLMNSILDPSAIIEPGFMAYHCTLKNGEQLYGVIATETSASLTLKMAGNLTKSVLRSEIASLKSTGTSLMPEGLEAVMTPQSLADLIAYLKLAR